ncbi:MAG: acyl-CoA dehydrogenase family protein [Planctomycetota bacterium]
MADKSFLNWPFFGPEHREWAERLHAWSETALDSLVEAEHEAGHDDEKLDRVARGMVSALGEAGFLKAAVPGEYGGLVDGRLDVRTLCISRDLLARRSGLADFCFAMQGLGTGPVTLFGTEEQKARILPKVASGEHVAAFAISESDAGSDPASMTTEARLDGDSYRIDGQKTWISHAGLADHYVVFARTGEAPGAKGLSAFFVPGDSAGLSVSERIAVSAPHPLGTLEFDGCRVSAENRLGQPGEGFKIAMATLDVFRSTVGAAALGFARRAFDEAIDFAEQRRLSGTALADFQLTQDRLADMFVAIDTSALLIARSAWTKDTTGARVTREASMAKLHATETAQQVIDKAQQMLGGRGVVFDSLLERLSRELRPLRIYEGASEVQKLILARQARALRSEQRGES